MKRKRFKSLRMEQLEPRVVLSASPGLLGEYFNEINLTGKADERVDATVDFTESDWGPTSAPAGTSVIADDNYSERWTGFVKIDNPGDWTFYTQSNDGVRLWVGGQQVINNWNQHTSTEDSATVNLDAGWHPIQLEHFQQDGTVVIQLSFSGPGQSKTIIPSTHLSTENPDTLGFPTANAGSDQTVALPDNSVTLSGSGTDSDGTISSYQWTQLSGPNNASLSGANSDTLTASNLQKGTYEFQLTVTDNDGNTDSDTALVNVVEISGDAVITGELKKWHKVTLTFDGPQTSEMASTNPFTDYRLNVTFTHAATGKTYVVPGYFAADGDAANTSATGGNKWRAHFAPSETGEWTWTASFRTGNNVAISDSPTAGSSAGYFDGTSGTLTIADTDKSGDDLRSKGLLQYVGGHYLQFAETGEYFLKQGPDAPENLLAYEDFDNTPNNGGRLKSYAPHARDWNAGDPSWAGGKGTELIGAVNYLASEGLNSISFIPMNIGGDDKNVFPYVSDSSSDRTRIDVSKLAQWEVVFEHATQNGFFLHFKTQETENELLLDGGNMGVERTVYYRELIARFGHHLALNWNLGEEINNATTAQKQAWAQYFADHDPYRHHIVIHNGANHYDLLGDNSELTGFSLQTNREDFANVHSRVLNYLTRSDDAGKPWAVAVDEPGDAQHALRPDDDAGNSHEDGRKNGLWGALMAGAWGNEWYFGYAHHDSDLTLQDFRSRDDWWDYTRYALEFFENNDIPFWEMHSADGITSNTNDFAFVKEGEVYVVYLKSGGTTNLDLSGQSGTFEVKWYDPRNGGNLQNGTVQQVSGGGNVSLGNAPGSTNQDWAILVRKTGVVDPNDPPNVNNQTFNVDENASSGTVVGTVNASDPDGDSLTFAITGGNTNNAFAINNNGVLTVNNSAALDFETKSTYSLNVQVSDGSLSDSATITVNLNDVVENPLPAPWLGGDIGNVAAAGSAEYNSGVFTVRGSGNDIWNQSDEFHFVYQSANGDGEVIARVTGQTNTNQWAKAGVMIRDSLDPSSTHAMMVITPGNGASFQNRTSFGASSNHTTTGGLDVPIWVRVVRSGNTFTGYTSSDGTNWVQRGQTTISMGQDVFVGLAVTSHNDGAISTATIDNVSVDFGGTQNQPPNISNQSFNVDENSPNGTVVGTVSASDPDGDSLTYSITGGNTNNAFAINSSTGQLTVNNSSALDFETTPTFNLSVQVSDGSLSDSATVTVNLNDLAENGAPNISNQSFSVDENSPGGTVVGTVAASDPDGDSLTYSITGGNTSGAFAINSSTGQLTVSNSSALDFETTPTFNLAVEVSDGNLADSATVTVNLNDLDDTPTGDGAFLESGGVVVMQAESFTAKTTGSNNSAGHEWLSASISGASGTAMEAVPNSGVNTGDTTEGPRMDYDIQFSNTGTYYVWIRMHAENTSNNSVHAGLNGTPTTFGNLGMSSGTGSWHWEQNVNGRSGDVRVTINVASAGVHTFNVWMREDGVAVDKIVLTQNASFVPSGEGPAESGRAGDVGQVTGLTLYNADTDQAIQTLQNGDVINLADVGTTNVTVLANTTGPVESVRFDLDGQIGSQVENIEPYALFGDTSGDLTGGLTLGDHTVSATPFDGADATGNLGPTVSVSFTLINESNTAPVVNNQSFSVDENSANGTVVGTVSASDADGDSLSYSITSGNTNGAFAINSSSGQITVANSSALDFESQSSFSLAVQVSDGSLSDSATVTVNVNDVNENQAPNVNNQSFSVDENSPGGTVVGTVSASDPDGDSLSYSITGGNTNGAFAINSSTGQITVANSAALDFESQSSFGLAVQVSDGSLSDSATVTVNVNDVDESTGVGQVTSFTLINADTDQAIGTLNDGAAIDLSTLSTTNLSIRANVSGTVESVRFDLDGQTNVQTENVAPYALFGDNSGDYNPGSFAIGHHKVSATPYSADKRGGEAGETVSVTFTVVDGTTSAVTSFTLIDADTDQAIATIHDGDTINLAKLPANLTFRANVVGSVESVNFDLDGADAQTENVDPYALFGDTNGDYKSGNISVGSHTLTATPYSADNQGGTAGLPLTISFNVINDANADAISTDALLSDPDEVDALFI